MSGCPLPNDAIFNILVLLPVKALCKFRCVSKSWHALTSDPFFLESQQKKSERNPLLVINSVCPRGFGNIRLTSVGPQGLVVSEFVKSLEHDCGAASLFTCLDLVCMHDCDHIYLCNPTTGETCLLPQRPSQYYGAYFIHALAFGYLSDSMEYKILTIYNLKEVAIDDPPYLVCEVMSIRKEGNLLRMDDDSCSWREMERPPFIDIGRYQAVVNGSFHVVPFYEYKPSGYYDYHWIGDGIGRFDLAEEEWSMFPPPPELSTVSGNVCLGETGGRMFLADVVEEKYIDMWLLEEYHSGSWIKKYRVDIAVVPSVSLRMPISSFLIVPRAIMKDGRILLEHEEQTLQYYDPKTKLVESVNIPHGEMFTISLYVESFVSFRVAPKTGEERYLKLIPI